MIAFHVITHLLDKSARESLEELHWSILFLGFLFLLTVSFRSFFLMISAVVNTSSMQYNLFSGEKPLIVWKKQLISGTTTYIAGLITESILGPNAFIPISIEYQVFSPQYLSRVLHFEALMAIGLCMILISTIHFFLSINNGYLKYKRNIAVYVILGIVVICVTPFIKELYNLPYIGVDPGDGYYVIPSIGNFFTNLALSPVFGFPQRLFPFLATACIGSTLAIFLTNYEKFQKPKWIVRGGKILGATMILTGTFMVLPRITEVYMMFEQKFFVHPLWFWFMTNGFQLMIIVWFLGMNEFNSRKTGKNYLKHTLLLRRWGMVSMSLFIWQAYPELLLRYLGNWITPYDFISRHVLPAIPMLILMLLTVAVWDGLIRLWERANFKGSLEWIMQIIKKRKYEIDISGILYDVEPIRFVDPLLSEKIIATKI